MELPFYDLFSKTVQITAKMYFLQKQRFQAETNVFHEFALLDLF